MLISGTDVKQSTVISSIDWLSWYVCSVVCVVCVVWCASSLSSGAGFLMCDVLSKQHSKISDIVIIMSYAMMDFEEAKSFKPSVVFPDSTTNKLV